MKILFINTNQIVQKLVEVTAQKANVELVSVSEAKQVGDMEQYDYIIADDDCYNLEKEQFDALIKGRRACLIYSKRDGMPSGFSEYIKKPFIPTHVLDIILQEIAKLQTKEHFNAPKQEAQEQTPQEPQEQEASNQEASNKEASNKEAQESESAQPQESSAQTQESQESSEPLSDLSALSKELNLETTESHEPSEDNEEKSEKIDTQDLLGDLDLEVPDDKELDELSSLQTPDPETSEKGEKEKVSLDSINFNEDDRHEGSPMEDLDALLAHVDGLDEVTLDNEQSAQEAQSEQNPAQDEAKEESKDKAQQETQDEAMDAQEDSKDLESAPAQEDAQEQSTQASAESAESDEINLEDLDLGLDDILEDNKDLGDLQEAISLDTQENELENNLESNLENHLENNLEAPESNATQETAQQENLNKENLDLENLEEVDSAPAQSPQVLDSAQLSEVSDLLHEIESPSKVAQPQDSAQSDGADESHESVQEPQSAQDEDLESLDLGLEDINLDDLEIPTDALEDNKELDTHEFGDLELGEDLGMASLNDLKAELEDSKDPKEASDLTESAESNEAFFAQDENQAQSTQTSENEADENEISDGSDEGKVDDEGKIETLDEPSAQDSEISEIDTASLDDLDTAEIQSLENENLEVSDALPDELAPHLENTAQEEQPHEQNDDLADLESLGDLDMQSAQEESKETPHEQEAQEPKEAKEEDSKASQISQESIESAPESTQDFQSLSENEVRQALGEAIDESAEAQNLASAQNLENTQLDSKDMQIDEITLPKDLQTHQNALQEISDSLNKTISQSLQNIQSSETKELLNGLEVTINISFKDKHND